MDSQVSGDWESQVWNASSGPSAHANYRETIAAIREVADYYQINTNLEGCTISPLHFIFAKYIKNAPMEDKILDKIQKIEPEVVNIRKLVLLA